MKQLIIAALLFLYAGNSFAQQSPLAIKPPMGWNSFDSYGVYLYEKAAFDNLKVLADKYRPYGYEYFVVDNGWFGEYKLRPGTIYSVERHASDVNINEFGLLQPSSCYFPNGFLKLINECHSRGLKFGLHLMRGIPRKAVELNLPIQGTMYHAQDIADTVNVCNWCHYNYGVDMSKPGAQEFYNSLIDQLAAWGVDFIKVDDIVPYPKEVEALVHAVKQCGRNIIVSLSPGDRVPVEHIDVYKQANMLRVTGDVWDTQSDIDKCFTAWKKWTGYEEPGFWLDMDMIPFGKLQLMSPATLNKEDISKSTLYAGKGYTRNSELSKEQMKTFITMRALAASPLMIGGDLLTMDAYSDHLLTNPDILACNQNGKMGKLLFKKDGVEIWKVANLKSGKGWFGIFNRTRSGKENIRVDISTLDIAENAKLHDIWNNKQVVIENKEIKTTIPGQGVVFIRYDIL